MAYRNNDPVAQSDVAAQPGTSVSVGTSSTEVVAANGARVAVVIGNDHATQVLYLSLGGTAVANEGIRVNAAGGQVTITSYTGAINGIATGASTTALVAEV